MKRSPMPPRKGPLRRGLPLVSKRTGNRRYASAREAVRARAKGWCEIRVSGVCAGKGTEAHHRLRRSQGGPDHPDNLAWSCDACHRHVHDNPEWAYRLGWLLRRVA